MSLPPNTSEHASSPHASSRPSRNRRWRRPATVLAAVTAVTALATSAVIAVQSTAPATAGASEPAGTRRDGGDGSDAGLERFTGQKLTWHTCQTGPDDGIGKQLTAVNAECADVTVPRDYTKPDGPTLTVAISRRKATDTAHRIGTLFLNGGGPSESMSVVTWVVGTFPLNPTGAPKVAARYDLVAMDPRGHSRSTPIDCRWPNGVGQRYLSVGLDRASFEQSSAAAKDLAGRCAGQKEVLPHMSTRNMARDMNVIRAVLGEKKLSYLGISYGAYLGGVFAQLFPHQLDRVVLDSATDPNTWGPEQQRDRSPAQVAAQRNWAAWAARRDRTYHLGSTTAQVMRAMDVIRKVADRGRPVRMGRHQVDLNVIRGLGVPYDTEENYAGWSRFVGLFYDAARGRKVTLTPEDDEIIKSYSHTSTEVIPGDDASAATACADRAASSREPETYYRDIQAHRDDERFFGPPNRNVTTCSFWPTTQVEAPTKIQNAVPVLMTGSAGDFITPYPGQLAMHRALTGSRLITLNGAFRHGAYLMDGNECVNNQVDQYLLTGDLPTTDITCTRTSPTPKKPSKAGVPASTS